MSLVFRYRLLTLALAAGCVVSGESVRAESGFRFVTLDYPPLSFADTKGEVDGAAVRIVREVMKNLGHPLTIEVLPWTRALELAKDGKADAIFTAYRNAERDAFLDFTASPIIDQVMVLFAAKDRKITFDGDLMALADLSIGTVSTVSYGQKFDGLRDKLRTERVNDSQLNFKKLVGGRIDLVISNRYTADADIETLGLRDAVRELSPPVEVIHSYVGFSKQKKLTALRDAFDRGLLALVKSGRYAAILREYKVRLGGAP